MGFTIVFINTATDRAGATGILWIDQDYRHTSSFCLVLDKVTQLKERPVAMLAPLLAANRYPVTNALQVFQGNCASGALRFLNKPLTDHVVDTVGNEADVQKSFFQFSFCRFCALALEIPATSLFLRRLRSTMSPLKFSPSIGCKVDDAKVNAKHIFHIGWFRLFYVASGEQVKLVINADQIALPALAFQKFTLALSTSKRYAQASRCPDRHFGGFPDDKTRYDCRRLSLPTAKCPPGSWRPAYVSASFC